jgi:DNA repair protein RadC
MQNAYKLEVVKTKLRKPAMEVTSPKAVAEFNQDLTRYDREHFVRLDLDTQKRVIGRETVHIGTIDQVVIHPTDVFRGALLSGAAGVVLVHNHPSGDPEPSENDQRISEQLHEIANLLQLEIVDCVIVAEGGCYWSEVDDQVGRLPQTSSNQQALTVFNE